MAAPRILSRPRSAWDEVLEAPAPGCEKSGRALGRAGYARREAAGQPRAFWRREERRRSRSTLRTSSPMRPEVSRRALYTATEGWLSRVQGEHEHRLLPRVPRTGNDAGPGACPRRGPSTSGRFSLVKAMKGRSSRMLPEEFPSTRRRVPRLGTNRCFLLTLGFAPLAIDRQDIREREGRASRLPAGRPSRRGDQGREAVDPVGARRGLPRTQVMLRRHLPSQNPRFTPGEA